MAEVDEKSQKKISSSKQRAEHPFAGRNTQHSSVQTSTPELIDELGLPQRNQPAAGPYCSRVSVFNIWNKIQINNCVVTSL